MQAVGKFAQAVEAADQLPLEDQEMLIELLRRRLTEHRRAELIQDVREGMQEFKSGLAKPAHPDEIMRDILA